MWIAKGWRRTLRHDGARRRSGRSRSGRSSSTSPSGSATWRCAASSPARSRDGSGLAFAVEILLGGLVPLVLLASRSLRARPEMLFWAALLAVLGIVYNRMNVVLFAMTFRGRMPWVAPALLCAVDLRVGHLGRPDRRDDLSLRAGRAAPSRAPAQRGAVRTLRGRALTPDAWLERHPYLRALARFSSQVDAAAASFPSRRTARMPDSEDSRRIPCGRAASPELHGRARSRGRRGRDVSLVHDLASECSEEAARP